MWSFLCQKYESTGQSTYLAAIHQEQLLHQGDTTVEDFFDQLSIVWHQLDTLGPQLSPATCQSCRDQTAALELCRTYDFLTRLRDEFEPLRTQLLARRPYVSLMDALTEVHNKEVRLRDVGLLQSATVLAARSSASRSSSTRPTASMPLASPPVVPHAARGESGDLHCDHCGRDGHVEAFCYRKKKAQACRSSQGTGDTGSRGSERSSAGSETQEILILLRRLAASTSTGAGQGTLSSDSFHVPNVSLIPDLTMQLMSTGQIADHDCHVILDPDVCYIQDRRTGHLVGTGPHHRDSQHLWELDWLHLPSAASASPISSTCAASSTSSFAQWHHHLGHLSDPRLSALLRRGLLGSVSGRESLDHCQGCLLESKFRFHIPLVRQCLSVLLILSIQMFGVQHLLYIRVVINTTSFL
jgi:hypothetical protein